jgi:2'-hydroxyisoflavone reductase
MKCLILGGTRFLGRHLVEQGKAGGHTITLFHRGQGGCSLYPEVEHIHGNRDGELRKLAGRRWDVAIDTSGYVPRLVGASARALAEQVEHYTFVSSISVYPKFWPDMTEEAPVSVLSDPTVEEITGETYGGLKVLCEQAAEDAMPGRVCHVRSGLIVGPHDPTDRFTYWVRRVSTGGKVLAPGPPERSVQLIHGADLADWMLRMAANRKAGVFHAVGPAPPHTLNQVLDTCREASGSNASWVWASEPFLVERKVEFWSDLPVCVTEDAIGVMDVNIERAVREAIRFRPLLQTVRETLAWDMSRPPGTTLKAGLAPARELELIQAWEGGQA